MCIFRRSDGHISCWMGMISYVGWALLKGGRALHGHKRPLILTIFNKIRVYLRLEMSLTYKLISGPRALRLGRARGPSAAAIKDISFNNF